MKKTHDVFGISNKILEESYVNRGGLDEELVRQLERRQHIALCGESKCGKSWLRQKTIPNAIVVQCRLGRTVIDIYTDALSQLGVVLKIEESSKNSIKGSVSSTTTLGSELILKLKVKLGIDASKEVSEKFEAIGQDINDLRFIADLINESGKKLVIEDFHYLSIEQRNHFSYDLKALWDYGCFVVIIGVWNQSNLLIYLNPDLSGRIVEIPLRWLSQELDAILEKGSRSLQVRFSSEVKNLLISNSFSNAGLLQQLTILLLDEHRVFEQQTTEFHINSKPFFENAAMKHAEQLNPLYQQFAKRVSAGIRKRPDSTAIYGHTMAVIVSASDASLINGLSVNDIYTEAHNREKRIQKGNLKSVLRKIEELQVDDNGLGLVIAYNDTAEEVTAIDKQLLFYRKYLTVNWPWEELIEEQTTA